MFIPVALLKLIWSNYRLTLKQISSFTVNFLNTTLLWSSIYLDSNMFSFLLQRRNFTLAFQAAESVGIKSTLVSFKHILNELHPIRKK